LIIGSRTFHYQILTSLSLTDKSSLLNSGFLPNQKTDKQGIYWELMEGGRTEIMNGSTLHKWSKSSYQNE